LAAREAACVRPTDDEQIVFADDVWIVAGRYLALVMISRRKLFDRVHSLDSVRVDYAAALVMLVALEAAAWTGSGIRHRWVAGAAAIVPAVAVAIRRRWVLQALAVGVVQAGLLALVYGSSFGGGQGLVGGIGAILIFYGAGAFVPGRRSWIGLALGLALASINSVTQGGQVATNLLFADGGAVALPWLLGRTSSERTQRARAARELAERLDAEREQSVRAAALAERTRLAREIHDVIAHSVSVMVIQAGGARAVMATEPERAERSVLAVERAGREALAEMRRLLGVLGERDELRMLSPQPGLADLHELVARTRAAGLPARLSVEGNPVSVSQGLSLCVYRVVQEALTNALKHAGPATAEVSVRWGRDALELEVSDDGRGPTVTPGATGGHGIAGMRERAALHGGSVEAGPAGDRGFAVRARIPLAGGSTA
jgi:signal transduction histidine kinase